MFNPVPIREIWSVSIPARNRHRYPWRWNDVAVGTTRYVLALNRPVKLPRAQYYTLDTFFRH